MSEGGSTGHQIDNQGDPEEKPLGNLGAKIRLVASTSGDFGLSFRDPIR